MKDGAHPGRGSSLCKAHLGSCKQLLGPGAKLWEHRGEGLIKAEVTGETGGN